MSVDLLLFLLSLVRFFLIHVIDIICIPFVLIKWLIFSRVIDAHGRRHKRRLEQTLVFTEDYTTWKKTAQRIDRLNGYEEWSTQYDRTYFNPDEIEQQLARLRELRQTNNAVKMGFHLRAVLNRGLGGMNHPSLFQYYCGTKKIIHDYVAEVVEMLEFVKTAEGLEPEQKYSLFRDTAHSYGKTALLLGATNALGTYHAGVIKGLYDADLLPNIIAASGVGSIVAALACCTRKADFAGLWDLSAVAWNPETKPTKQYLQHLFAHWYTTGDAVGTRDIEQCLKQTIGNMTFEDSFQKTSSVLNIVVPINNSLVVLNYVTSPYVVIWSAVCASIAGTDKYKLMYRNKHSSEVKEYLLPHAVPDLTELTLLGGIPIQQISRIFNTNFYILSQVNPLIVPMMVTLFKPTRGTKHHQTRLQQLCKWLVKLAVTELHHVVAPLLRHQLISCPSSLKVLLLSTHSAQITIAPAVTIDDFTHSFRYPSKEHLENCIVHGCRRAWLDMTTVEYHCRIERTLDHCLRECSMVGRYSPAVASPTGSTGTGAGLAANRMSFASLNQFGDDNEDELHSDCSTAGDQDYDCLATTPLQGAFNSNPATPTRPADRRNSIGRISTTPPPGMRSSLSKDSITDSPTLQPVSRSSSPSLDNRDNTNMAMLLDDWMA